MVLLPETSNNRRVAKMTNDVNIDAIEQAEPKARPTFKRVKAENKTVETTTEPTPAIEQTVASQPVGDLHEMGALIQIKDYIGGLINGNFTLPKDQMKDLQKIHLLMDKKIVGLVLSDAFKASINFEEGDKAVKEAAWNSNIKSSLYR